MVPDEMSTLLRNSWEKTGRVVGVDMTQEQLEVANEYKEYHAEKFGFENVEFLQGYLEHLDELAARTKFV